jgi:hypothetical protein
MSQNTQAGGRFPGADAGDPMKKQMKKLELSKETLRNLETAKLAGVGGGTDPLPADPISYLPEQCSRATC